MANATKWPVKPIAAAEKKSILAKAKSELAKRELDVSLYSSKITDRGDWITVIFRDRNADMDPQARGSSGVVPTFEVQFDRDTLGVRKAYFAR